MPFLAQKMWGEVCLGSVYPVGKANRFLPGLHTWEDGEGIGGAVLYFSFWNTIKNLIQGIPLPAKMEWFNSYIGATLIFRTRNMLFKHPEAVKTRSPQLWGQTTLHWNHLLKTKQEMLTTPWAENSGWCKDGFRAGSSQQPSRICGCQWKWTR